METILNLVLLAVGFLSFLPVIHLNKRTKDKQYVCLKYLMNTTFVWTVMMFVERISEKQAIIYYAHMLGYPIKFLLAVFLLCTIYNYIEKKFPKPIFYVFIGLFLVEYVIAITNNQTKYFLQIAVNDTNTFKDLYEASNGILFIYHLILTYVVVVSSVVFLVVFLKKKKTARQYKSVTRTLVYSSLLVLTVNLSQLFIGEIYVDLTYISLVIVTFALYQVIYHQDMIFNLKTSGRGEILSNMREMYIITDRERRIVEISQLIQEKYELVIDDYIGKTLDNLFESLKDRIVFYKSYDMDSDAQPNKDHFHVREKKFTLKGINDFGYMILLYDETQVFSLLRELNKLSNYDNMTGLHNRNFMESYLQKLEKDQNYSVISLDLNGLKANNDYLGHERGDFLLKALADKMKEVLFKYEHKEMARIGGDEFLIVVLNEELETIQEIRNQLLKECEAPNILDKISVSIGIATKKDIENSVYDLVKIADEDMYAMKSKTSREYSKQIVKYATNKEEYIR